VIINNNHSCWRHQYNFNCRSNGKQGSLLCAHASTPRWTSCRVYVLFLHIYLTSFICNDNNTQTVMKSNMWSIKIRSAKSHTKLSINRIITNQWGKIFTSNLSVKEALEYYLLVLNTLCMTQSVTVRVSDICKPYRSPINKCISTLVVTLDADRQECAIICLCTEIHTNITAVTTTI